MLPCCASSSFNTQEPFPWKNSHHKPSSENIVTHSDLLKKYNIPYIIDIHCHFFPEAVLRAIWKWFDKVNWKITYRFSEKVRLECLEQNNFQYYTTLNYAHKPSMAASLNLWIFENYRNWKGAIPFGTFYPEMGALDYVKKAVEEYGFQGFKLHCEVSKLNLNRSELALTFRYLEKMQIPIVIHTGTAPLPGEFTGIRYFKPFMETYPSLKVIVAHMGALEIEEYAELLRVYNNLYLDTTMVFVDFLATGDDTIRYLQILEKYNTRILFGSDFPNIPYNLSHPVEKLLNSFLKAETKQNIFYKNAHRLLAISMQD